MFFDPALEKSFARFFADGQSGADGAFLQSAKDKIHARQRGILLGFDRLIFFSAVIVAISILLIIFRQGEQKERLSRVQAAGAEQEKFSRNLHDGAAQDLAAARAYLLQGEKEKSEFYLNRAFEEVSYMIDSSRESIFSPPEERVRSAAAAFERNYGIKTSVQIASSLFFKLNQEQSFELFRIIQEALSNIARHADASEAAIKIIDVADSLIMRIHDNGKGFGQEAVLDAGGGGRKHWGLVSMKERAAQLGGTFEIKNEGGTTIAVRLEHPVS